MKKVLLIIGIILAVVIITPLIVVVFFKGTIVEQVKKEANKMLVARVNFDNDISLTVFKNFPNLSLGLKNLEIVGADSFASDTLVAAKEISVTLDIMSVIKGPTIEIKNIFIDQARINAIVLPSGKANWDIMKPDSVVDDSTPEDTASSFSLKLKKLEIKDADIVYDDRQGGIYAKISDFDHTLKGDFTADQTLLETESSIAALTVKYGAIPYLNKVKTALDADIDADLKGMKFTFKDNELKLNELVTKFDGWFAMPTEDYSMDIKFATEKSAFKNFLSLIPAVFTKDFGTINATGNLAFGGYVKGTYSEAKQTIPGFDIKLKIDQGTFQYPALPGKMQQIFVDLHVNNPDGVMDHTVVDLKKLYFNMGGDPFSARLLLKTPMSDPWMDMEVKGKLNLSNIKSMIPLQGTTISGLVEADMSATGNYSTIEKGDYEKFKAQGFIGAQQFVYKSDSLPYEVGIGMARLEFNPQQVSLPVCDMKIGNSDLSLKGSLQNFFGYFFRDQLLTGNLDIRSNYFNTNQFLSSEPQPAEAAPTAADTVPLEIFEVPANIDFTTTLGMQKIIYDNLELTQVKGVAKIKDASIILNDVSANIFGGSMKMNGAYSTVNPSVPEAKMNFTMNNIAVQKTFEYFTIVKNYMPAAQFVEGNMNADFSLNMLLGKDMMPVMNSITSLGKFELPNAKVSGVPALNKLAEALKVDKLKTLVLNKVLMLFEIKDGKFFTRQPYKFAAGALDMQVDEGGSTALDQSIDYKMKVNLPSDWFGGASTALNSLLKEAGKTSSTLKPGEKISVNALVGGTFMKPTITTSLKDIAKSVADEVKDAAKEKIKETVDDAKKKVDAEAQKLIDQARAAGDKLIADAEKQAQQIRDEGEKAAKAIEAEADKQAAQLVKDASNPLAKKAAEKGGEALKKKAADSANKVRNEANQKADAVVKAARDKSDQLIKDAEAKKAQTLK